jgi:hypothetical protein
VLIDGGQGQLEVARQVLSELGLEDIAIVGIAKGPDRDAGRERFFMPGRPPFSLEPRDPVLYFLQRLRDEAHRFAIGTHRTRRAADITKSRLDEVPGIGAGRKRALLHHFGSARASPSPPWRTSRRWRASPTPLPRKSMTTSGAVAKKGGHVQSPQPADAVANRCIPLVVACFWLDHGWAQWVSASLFAIACITDWFDGYFARRYHQISRFGRFLDPIADKLLVAAALVMLVDSGTLKGLNVLAALIILARESWSRPARVLGRAQDRRAGEPARQMEDRRPDGRHHHPAAGRCRSLRHRPDRAGADLGRCRPHLITGYDYLRTGLRHMAEGGPT